LLLTYALVSVATIAFAGVGTGGIGLGNEANADDVFAAMGHEVFGGGTVGWIMVHLLAICVLTSASASTQTTILPTARTTLSMARWGAIPSTFGRVSPRFSTPTVSTIAMGATSLVWFVLVNQLSTNVLGDSVSAIGFMIAFYYGLTGLACAVYYRRAIVRSVRSFVVAGLLPLLGFAMLAVVFVKAYIDYGTKGYAEDFNYTKPFHGIEVPILIGIGGLLLGAVLMLVARGAHRDFFRRPREAAAPDALDDHAPGEPATARAEG
jgi:amino acid transporter